MGVVVPDPVVLRAVDVLHHAIGVGDAGVAGGVVVGAEGGAGDVGGEGRGEGTGLGGGVGGGGGGGDGAVEVSCSRDFRCCPREILWIHRLPSRELRSGEV